MQIEIQIPKAVLFDVKYTVEQATNFAKKEVALGFYMQKGVSVALCSQIAGMSEKEFLVEVKDVIQICEPGGRILDPFAGAGTTILAAVEEGYEAVGIEVTDAYYKLGSDRVKFCTGKQRKKRKREITRAIHMDVQIYFRRRNVHPHGCRKGDLWTESMM